MYQVRFSPEQKHRELLENVIEFGLNQSQYLQEIQERDLWTKGASFISQSSSLYINSPPPPPPSPSPPPPHYHHHHHDDN